MNPKLEEVYKKWEARSSGPGSGGHYMGSATNEPQQAHYGPIRQPSRHNRPKKRRPKVSFQLIK